MYSFEEKQLIYNYVIIILMHKCTCTDNSTIQFSKTLMFMSNYTNMKYNKKFP